jgi:hypothetical protein
MNLEQSPIWTEVQKIVNDTSKPVWFYWTATIHVGNTDYDSMIMVDRDEVCDFQKNISDETTITVKVPMGVWAKQIYPNRTTLEVTLVKTPLQETAGGGNRNKAIPSQRFSASVVLEGLPILKGSDVEKISEETLNLRGILDIQLQLFSKSIEKIRKITVGGIYRKCTGSDVVRALLYTASNSVNIDTGKACEAVDMVEPINKTKRDHVVIPHGTKVVDVPLYVQNYCGGIYNTGINAYLRNKTWFVYPLYDTTRIAKATKTLTIIKVPHTQFQQSPVTYRVDGESIYILASSDSSFADDAGSNFLNHGNGVRYLDANALLDNPLTILNNKAILKRSEVAAEFITRDLGRGVNNVQAGVNSATANPYKERSRLAALQGGIFQFVWENSNSDILDPGMPVRVIYLDGGNVVELTGVLLFSHTNTHLKDKTITTKRHASNSALAIFVNPPSVT